MIRTVALRGLAVAISVALLWWLAADARWHGIGQRLQRIDGRALLGVALLFAASYAMRGARIFGEFRDELDASTGQRNYLRILRLTLVHNALVNVLPFRSGEVAFPVLLASWFGIGSARAVVSLLWLRAQDAIVVLALAALVWPDVPIAWRAFALVAIIAAAAIVPAWARRRRGSIRPGSTTVSRLGDLLERSTRRSAAGWSWTIGNWSAKLIAETWLVASALGPEVHASTAIAALGAIGAELAAILPVQGVAGFGSPAAPR
jgi:hypothetical protein